MTTIGNIALWGASIAFIVLAVQGLRFHLRFLDRLRSGFPQEWTALGSPDFSNPEGSKADWLLFSFILWGEFYRLGDPVLNANGRSLRICFFLALICLGVLMFALRSHP